MKTYLFAEMDGQGRWEVLDQVKATSRRKAVPMFKEQIEAAQRCGFSWKVVEGEFIDD